MIHSKRIATLATYIRSKELTSEEICRLLDIVSDKFKSHEQKQAKQREKVKRNLDNINKYLTTQAM